MLWLFMMITCQWPEEAGNSGRFYEQARWLDQGSSQNCTMWSTALYPKEANTVVTVESRNQTDLFRVYFCHDNENSWPLGKFLWAWNVLISILDCHNCSTPSKLCESKESSTMESLTYPENPEPWASQSKESRCHEGRRGKERVEYWTRLSTSPVLIGIIS